MPGLAQAAQPHGRSAAKAATNPTETAGEAAVGAAEASRQKQKGRAGWARTWDVPGDGANPTKISRPTE